MIARYDGEVPPELDGDTNRAVLAWLAATSAHSDVADALWRALEPLGEASVYSPSFAEYRYVAAFTNATVFAFAHGMRRVAFRLPPTIRERALATGAAPIPDLAPSWVEFELFRDDWPEVDTRFFARQAYAFARDGGPGTAP